MRVQRVALRLVQHVLEHAPAVAAATRTHWLRLLTAQIGAVLAGSVAVVDAEPVVGTPVMVRTMFVGLFYFYYNSTLLFAASL